MFADVTARVVSYEKEIINENPKIKVTSEYTYPDGTKHIGVTRYSHRNFSKAKVEADVQWHVKIITKYYLKENSVTLINRKDEMINDFITQQDNAIGADAIVNITYTLKDLYLDDLDITIPATGTTKDEHK